MRGQPNPPDGIEECFDWIKTIAGLRNSRFVGREKLYFQFVLCAAAYNLARFSRGRRQRVENVPP
ncbi:hypothetical protein BJI67_09715 [Acidihalobacter aeolianus]|uniref:Transposase DDE domain-containing protein n=1 Tax=Acidihalobacter aeolianus TaxID=2792603 RepID=A0A1D8K8N1_9GAMM|nr:hypothetical protein [Acidihalobacter aeolianus]AOV17305.1 hypothetical protein BJI67_09715 [Acidihalobacter aeolianus]